MRLALVDEQKVPGDVHGIALEGERLLVNVGGVLRVYGKDGLQPPPPILAQRALLPDVRVPVGDELFDVATQEVRSPLLPKALKCEPRSKVFSQDGSRMSADCQGPQGDTVVVVFDTKTRAELGTFAEFQTAAPIRAGSITESGNFVFWQARASGAFEEIKSHVTGPMMSSHSVMAPDEHALFTVPDHNWMPQDKTPARVLDPHTGRTLFTLPLDVDTVYWSPAGRLLAAHHSKNWGDPEHGTQPDTTHFTLHRGSTDVLVDVPGNDAEIAAFSRDDKRVAVRYASGTIRVFSLGP